MKRLYTSKRNLCPVCGNRHGCAIREDNLVECLRSTSQHDAPQGYRFIKLLRNGMGGLFALANDQRPEPRRQERQQQEKKAAERAKGALPVPECDRAIRKLHSWFGLGSRHRQDLRDRGLTDAQIDAVPFFSIYPDQELPPGIPANLPGVTRRGDKLYAAGSGYICPSFDLEGRVGGWQIRYDNPEEAGGKYKWPVNPHLPITVCRPVGGVKRPGVRFAEGFLKPYIAAQKRGQIFIGSPNGLFANSPKQTLAALEAYCVDRAVTLAPDAGDVCNRQVMQRWDGQIRWLQSQGYTVSVEWWGQLDKSRPDVDELTGDEAIATITPEEFLALGAQHSGYTPSIQATDTDRPISRDEWELKHGFGQWLQEKVERVLGKAKGFAKKPASAIQKPAPPSIIRYPKDALPAPADYEGRDLPRIIFKKGYRLEVLAKLKELGWKFVCDRSFMGLGKSHDAGSLYPDPDGISKIWYFDQSHTNPSTGTVEEMSNMPPRHNGMVPVEGKLTPKGNPHLRWAKPDEVPLTPSLCHNAELFTKLRSKGWDVDAEHENIKTEEGEKLSRNPICKGCRFSHRCHKEIGEGYGYLAVRRETMEARRIRAGLDSAPNPHGEKSYDYSSDTAFIEEASRYLQGIQSFSAWGNDLAQLWGYVERKAPDAFAALQPIRFALQDALQGSFDCIEKGVNRGVDHETLIENLPHPSAIADLPNLILQVRQAMPSIKDVVEEPDSVTGLGGKWRSVGQFARDMFKSQAAYQTKENIESLPPNILIDALEVWAGIKTGSLRVHRKQLHVTVPHTRHADVLNACEFVVLLDATPNTQYLEKILGDRILEIEQERPPLSNLTVVNVDMKGMGSNQISDACKNRQLALLEWIREQHQEVKVLANKADSHLPLDGWWFNDNRGSNAFKGVEALAAFNTPRPNLGVVQDEYRSLFGSLEGFEQYYQELIQSEIIQLIGRPRAHQYPDKQFSLYLTSTNQDLSFLTDLGCQVTNKEAFELTPLAGTAEQITRWKILQAVGQLQDQGQKLTQEAIAPLIGKSQELVSKIAKEFGGWKALKKLLLVLLELYRGGNNFDSLTDDERYIAENYLPDLLGESPEVAVREIGQIIRVFGFRAFLRILTAASPQTQVQLLVLLLQALPKGERSRLLPSATG